MEHLDLRSFLSPDFRDSGALCVKPPATFRVLVAGDSYAYGLGVRSSETMPAQLQRILNERRDSSFVEVINLGRPGLNLVESWALLRQVSSFLEHDLLVLAVSSDDAHPWSQQELAQFRSEWRAEWLAQWHPDRRSLPHALFALLSIAKEVQAAKRRLVVTFYEPVTSTELPLAILTQVCADLGILFVDLVTPFARFDPALVSVSAADRHPSPLAHRIAAIELAQALRPYLPSEYDDGRALCARLSHLARAASDHLGSAELYLQLAGAAPITAACEELRHTLNDFYAAVHRWSLLRAFRLRIGELDEMLFRLDRFNLLAKMGVAEAQGGDDATSAFSETRELVEQIRALLSSEPPRNGSKSDVAEIEAVRAQIEERIADFETPRRTMSDEVIVVCDRVANVSAKRAIPAAAKLLEIINGWLRRMANELALGDGSSEVVVEVQVPPDRAPYHMSLVGTYTAFYPEIHQTRQRHYVILDGTAHRYALDLPPGTVGSLALELECSEGPERAAMSAGVEFIVSARVVRGETERDYSIGDLLLVPLPKATA